MALYAALTVWLLVIMFAAWGVHRLWCGLITPRAVNSLLLPGTLAAQLGHVLGLLLSGNSVKNVSLLGDGKDGAPQADASEAPKLPILGSLLVGLLPLTACAVSVHVCASYWGGGILAGAASAAGQLPQALPTTMAGVWDLLRTCIGLMENVYNAIVHSDLPSGPTVLFLYLAVCLTVRMAPFEGHQRGALGAAALAAVVICVVASVSGEVRTFVQERSWPVLSFAAALLLVLLLATLLVRGVVGLIRVLAKGG